MAEMKVDFNRLNDFNWPTWRFRVELVLMKEDLWSTVKDAKPAETTSAWTRKDEKARAIIGLALEDSQLSHIMDVGSAKEMWDKLKSYHERGSLTNKIHVLRKLCSLRLEEGGNMSEHLVEATNLAHRLARMGEALKEHLVVAILLSSLPETYNTLVTALEGRPEEDMKLDYVKGKLLDEWRRRNQSEVQENFCEKAMKSVVQPENRRKVKQCYYCRQDGHFRWNCPILMEQAEVSVQKQSQAKSVRRSHPESDSNNRNVCFTTRTGSEVSKESRWIIDTGCTKHMTGSVTSLSSRMPCQEKVALADGRTLMARGCGTGRIVGRGLLGESVEIKLNNLLFVPGLTGSVLSVSQITENGYSVLFGPTGCRILEGENVIAVGKKCGGLYYLEQ